MKGDGCYREMRREADPVRQAVFAPPFFARGAVATKREPLVRLYETSARYEYLFFDVGWKKEERPAAGPRRPGESGDVR